MNCTETVTVEMISTIVPQTCTICGCVYMQINYLPAGELEVSPVTLYTEQSSTHKRCFIRYYMQDEMKMTQNILKTVGFHQKYSDIKTLTLGFDCETSRISVGGIYNL